MSVTKEVPLAVDLDGSLVKSNLLIESCFALMRQKPQYVFMLPLWLARGRAYLKTEIARRAALDIEALPYHPALLDYLDEQKRQGRRLVLATAAARKYAEQVADHLGFFDEVLATAPNLNLRRQAKRDALVERFGAERFDYVGGDAADLPIWSAARKAILVDPSPAIARHAAQAAEIDKRFDAAQSPWRALLAAIRPHQWLKNILLFVPLAASHQLNEPELLLATWLGFFAFSLCASSVYLLNDLLDLPDDRRHPSKRHRPFAAGSLPLMLGIGIIPLLLGSALGLALFISPLFLAVLATYYVITLAYSLWLKQIVIADVLTLAVLYTLRVIGGAAAIVVAPSFWLLAFSMFLFLSLALVKRYTELITLREAGRVEAGGRGYSISDLELLSSLGAASGYLAVLVLALYINSDAVTQLYDWPELIWLLCPILLFWISRVWVIAHRGRMQDDPILFAIRDRVSLITTGLAFAVLLVAAETPFPAWAAIAGGG